MRKPSGGKLCDDVVRIGVFTDMSGIYADLPGEGAVEAVKMAVDDFGGKIFGKPIEVVFADHRNKADIGADLIADLSNSGVALAVATVAKKKPHIIVNRSSNVGITNQVCSPYAYGT